MKRDWKPGDLARIVGVPATEANCVMNGTVIEVASSVYYQDRDDVTPAMGDTYNWFVRINPVPSTRGMLHAAEIAFLEPIDKPGEEKEAERYDGNDVGDWKELEGIWQPEKVPVLNDE